MFRWYHVGNIKLWSPERWIPFDKFWGYRINSMIYAWPIKNTPELTWKQCRIPKCTKKAYKANDKIFSSVQTYMDFMEGTNTVSHEASVNIVRRRQMIFCSKSDVVSHFIKSIGEYLIRREFNAKKAICDFSHTPSYLLIIKFIFCNCICWPRMFFLKRLYLIRQIVLFLNIRAYLP